MERQALDGLTVLEYGHGIPVPYCTKMLAEIGAEVIKIEEPGRGDETRRVGPFVNDMLDIERSGLFLYLNTSKLGITLNSYTELGKDIFIELVQRSDILVEDSKPGEMGKMGLDYEILKDINPKLIMTSVTPFGQTGPYANYKASNLVISNMSGFSYITPANAEGSHRPPLKAGGQQCDFQAGMNAAAATLCALYARDLTKLGQHVDISSQETTWIVQEWPISFYLTSKLVSTRHAVRLTGPSGSYPCKDGSIYIHCIQEAEWTRLVELMGKPDWANMDFFKDVFSRGQNSDALDALISDWTRQFTKEELYHKAQANRIPCAPAFTAEDLSNSEQLSSRDYFVEVVHPKAERLRYPGAPCKFSKTPWKMKRAAPLLGEHNEEIYCKRLGYEKADLAKMAAAGVL